MMYVKDMKKHCNNLKEDVEIYVKLPNGEVEELWSHYFKDDDGNIILECATPIHFKD